MKRIAGTVEYMMRRRKKESIVYFLLFFVCFMVIFFIFSLGDTDAARIKELGYINGVRSNQLIGYGLVVGLNGTGDKSNTLFTFQSLANLLDKMGVKVDPRSTKVNNVAAVMITADLPPFAKTGNKIDAIISSIGDAKSIEGGVLLLTQLKGADGEVYAIAQGPIVVGGFSVGGVGATTQKNHPTVGRIVGGVSIEKEIPYDHMKAETVVVSLKTPDFTNARKIVDRINEAFSGSAYAKDGGTINITIPDSLKLNPVKFLAMIEGLEIKPDNLAKIVVDEKTGTVVIGENVRISTVAISHGNISVQIKEDQKVSQPLPFSSGTTVATPDTKMNVEEEKGHFMVMEGGISIRELVNALNSIGVSTRDVIIILQTIKAAGALHADLEVI
jgi:flagellar P-ring protein precursor FlgI